MARAQILASLLFPGRGRLPDHQGQTLTGEGVRVRTLLAPDRGQSSCLVFSTGFGGSCWDYRSLARLLGREHRVARLAHPGSDRRAALGAFLRFLKLRLRYQGVPAAQQVRQRLHSQPERAQRVRQLALAVRRLAGSARLSLAGHSFGTDTVLRFMLDHDIEVDSLYLFSPHPPGYLLPQADYARLRARRVVVVTGTRDRTRDGVGPRERSRVADAIPGATLVVLDKMAHMDFALNGCGPPGWENELLGHLTLSEPQLPE